MSNLKSKLNGVVEPKRIARIEQALQARINPKIGIDAHIATSVVKGLLIHKERNLSGEELEGLDSGYCTLYREKRKGQHFVNGRQIKFYNTGGRSGRVSEQANAVFEALGINAVADVSIASAFAAVFSVTVTKRDPSMPCNENADIMELFAK